MPWSLLFGSWRCVPRGGYETTVPQGASGSVQRAGAIVGRAVTTAR